VVVPLLEQARVVGEGGERRVPVAAVVVKADGHHVLPADLALRAEPLG